MVDAVLVDIDGTAANMNSRGPYDYDLVGHDTINFAVWQVISALERTKDYQIIFASGRMNVTFPGKSGDKYFRNAYMPGDNKEYPTCFDLTLAWLSKFCRMQGMNPNPPLFMRRQDDYRPDWEVNFELYEEEISKLFNVKLVLDDRQQVVDMWRSLGLVCFQVAEGKF